MRLTLIATFATLAAASTPAHAMTNNQTCAQAQRDFERTGRVTTRTRSGKVLPIYGGLPVSQRARLKCSRFSVTVTKTVITTDDRSCVIAVRCG